MDKKISIIAADDHPFFLEGFCSVLNRLQNVSTVRGASSGKKAVELYEEKKADVVFLDIRMTDMNGIEAAKKILVIDSAAKIIALSMYNEWSLVNEMMSTGACGYILKDTGSEEIEFAMHEVLQGRHYFSAYITESMRDKINHNGTRHTITDVQEELSEREKEILKHIISGHSNTITAETLMLSIRTVEAHREHIYVKLKTKSPFGLSAYALQHNILPFPEK